MIFKQWQQVLDGSKTQTRRPVKEGETYHVVELGPGAVSKHWVTRWRFMPPAGEDLLAYVEPINPKWVIGRTYAVQPGRGKKAVGRIRITKIRRERLGDITIDDIFAEGIFGVPEYKGWYTYEGGDSHIMPLTAYVTLWDSIYGKGAWERMMEDAVWVLEFELVERKPI